MLKPLGFMCYYHPNLPASMVCFRCGRRICSACSKPYGEMTLCPTCYHTTAMNQYPAQPPTPAAAVGPTLYAQGVPQGGMIYGPYPGKPQVFRRFSWLVVLMLSVSSLLVAINAFALLWPSFFMTWMQFFPWIVQLGNFSFIFGVVLSIVIAGAIFLYMLGFKVLAAFMTFPTAILSLFIGGGFIVGLILGVLTGILMVMNGNRWH